MENASKALIMAGSVLLALLVIGSLVLMFNSLSNLKTEEAASDEVLKLIEYNKQIQTYNRELYGPELISLANLIQDYNYRQAELDTYDPITIQIDMTGLNEEPYLKKKYKNVETIIKDYKNLEKKLEDYKQPVKISGINVGKSAMEWFGMTDEQKLVYMQKFNSSYVGTIRTEMDKLANNYGNVRATLNNFKNRKFKPTFEDDKTGRVAKIKFTLIPI